MRRSKIIIFAFSAIALLAFKKDKPAYVIFSDEGKNSSYEKMLKAAIDVDIVMFGELHDEPIAHWLEYELAKDLQAELEGRGKKMMMGAEMFEADGQTLLDEYITGTIDQRNFEQQSRLWPNYKTDYKPLVEFAKEKNIPFIATNVPRRYASLVSKKGFEALDSLLSDSYQWIAPLPITYDPELPAYKEMLEMAEGHDGSENLPKAQALKDATMAYFILKNRKEGELFIHYQGAYHSDNNQGIVWYLKQASPELKILTISTVSQDDLDSLKVENQGKADFIIAVPESMTKTYSQRSGL